MLLEERLPDQGLSKTSAGSRKAPRISLDLIHATGVTTDASIIDIDGGASPLVDALLDEGFTRTIHQLYSD